MILLCPTRSSAILIVRVCLFFLCCIKTTTCLAAISNDNPKVLVVGASGSTGLRAIQGLLDVGFKPFQLQIMTRNSHKPKMKQMKQLGFGIVEGDLQDPASLQDLGKGCTGCYIHGTGSDTAELDTSEVSSAEILSSALHKDITSIVYNSAAAAKNHGVFRIQQKHDIEQVLSSTAGGRHFTSLRANIFMEELWKEYTRPNILDGQYPLPVHRWRHLYFTSVRDMGRLAGRTILLDQQQDATNNSKDSSIRIINVAGDCLTGPQIAKAYAKAQGSKCRHYNNSKEMRKTRETFPDLYEQIQFLQTSQEKTDIKSLKKEYPGLLDTFEEFLEDTRWGDRHRTFDNFSDPSSLKFK